MVKKRIAVVTGASSGIGREFAKLMADRQDVEEVWAIARSQDALEELRSEVEKPVRVIPCDLTKRDNLQQIAVMLRDHNVTVRFLINSAGFAKFCSYADIDVDTSLNMVDLNVNALIAMGLICLPYMESGAHIINMASQAAFQPLPYQNIYSSTKAFVRNYTRALNVELKERNICATAVCPGWMQTGLIARASIGAKKGTRYFPHTVMPDVVAAKALKDALKNKDTSIFGIYVKTAHVAAKILPQKLMMRLWLRQQKIK